MKRRPRLPDGSLGPLEEVFPTQIDPNIIALTEAVIGLQEQLMQTQAELEVLKGGGE